MIYDALILATLAHAKQTRRATGHPYIVHPIRVARLVQLDTQYEPAIAAAFLHDVLEDTSATIPLSFPMIVHTLVEQLTRRDGLSKIDTMRSLVESGNAFALLIKAADMADNLSDGMTNFKDGKQWARKHLERANILLEGIEKRDKYFVNKHGGKIFWTKTNCFIKLKSIVKELESR